ncbi:hypothetical protein BP6252_00393 [Coleophoma cylindrospora]|uniref:Enoyl reductase (ER) domain-containing protein n=1 Tax=Coleophoma cylindrospora TaxID=1849047 RepID=A0A3D8SQB3_9HELO|nr:hypothetical protein BP6252_00393 [Coleophoma cylindrospora]
MSTTTASGSQNLAAYLTAAKGPFSVLPAPQRVPAAGEVLVKVQACALQPADAKVAKLAVLPVAYPTILGSPVAGFVEAVGEGVQKVKVGDRVVASTSIFEKGGDERWGGVQRFAIVSERNAIAIPSSLSFENACATASHSPVAALHAVGTLNIPRASNPSEPAPQTTGTILIWGGSSAMGSLAISYAKKAGLTVITTCSRHNFDLVKSLGADFVLDYKRPQGDVVADLVKTAKQVGVPKYWFDTISLPASMAPLVEVISQTTAPDQAVMVLHLNPPFMFVSSVTIPPNVTTKLYTISSAEKGDPELMQWMLGKGGYLERGLNEGWLRGVPPLVLGGLDQVEKGIEMLHREEVSGQKLVVLPWQD